MSGDWPEEQRPWSDAALDGLLQAAARRSPRARARRRPALVAGALVAVAACLALVSLRLRGEPLHYEVGLVLGGASEARGVATTRPVRVMAESTLSLRLRPSSARPAPPCSVFTRCASTTRRVQARVVSAPGGGLEVSGQGREWFGSAPAACEVWLGLGDIGEGSLPPEVPTRDAGAQWLAVEVEYLGPLEPR